MLNLAMKYQSQTVYLEISLDIKYEKVTKICSAV